MNRKEIPSDEISETTFLAPEVALEKGKVIFGSTELMLQSLIIPYRALRTSGVLPHATIHCGFPIPYPTCRH
jgi:hypothetical protein